MVRLKKNLFYDTDIHLHNRFYDEMPEHQDVHV